MPKTKPITENLIIPEEVVMNQIYYIRDQKVMLDRDLAELYGVETRALKQAVRRNLGRFPEDFMFEMTQKEFSNWRSQIVISNSDKHGLRHPPFCFTEQGVAMLSSVLNSDRAIKVNIQIIRVFTKVRKALLDNTEIRMEIAEIKNILEAHSKRHANYDKNMEIVFQYLDELAEKRNTPSEGSGERKKIGYVIGEENKKH